MVQKNFNKKIRKPLLSAVDPIWLSLQRRRLSDRRTRSRIQQTGRNATSGLRSVNPGSSENLRVNQVGAFHEHLVFRASTAHYSF